MMNSNISSANVVMTTDNDGLTVETPANPIRFLAPKGMEAALGLDPNANYIVQVVPVPAGYRAVTQDEMETCKKPGAVVKFFSTKSDKAGAWKRVLDKEATTWDNNMYIVPVDTVLKRDLSGSLVLNGVEVELTDDQLEAIVTAVN